MSKVFAWIANHEAVSASTENEVESDTVTEAHRLYFSTHDTNRHFMTLHVQQDLKASSCNFLHHRCPTCVN